MKYGTREQTNQIDSEGSTLSSLKVYNGGEVVKDLVKHKMRVKVADVKQEMIEFMKFSDDIRRKREAHTLVVLKDDPTTLPAFVVEFPEFNSDDSYFVILQWTEVA